MVTKRKHVRATHKASPVAHRTKTKVTAHTTLVPKPQLRSAAPVSLVLSNAARSGSDGPVGFVSFLIVLGLVGAIACFALALAPATYIRWRPAAVFASERHVDLTMAGLALLTIVACMLAWGRAV